MRISHGLLLVVVALLGAGTVLGMVLLWPSGPVAADLSDPVQEIRLLDAELVDVTTLGEDDIGLLPGATVVAVDARIDETGALVSFEMVDDTGEMFATGQRVKLQEIRGIDGDVTYIISDFRRDWPLIVLVGLFLTAVLAFGRLQGARALLGLALTFAIIVGFIIPAILDGSSPVSVALVGAVAIMIVTLYLSHGFNPKTTGAVVGTALALLVTGGLAAAFVAAANLTGFTSEEARLANLEVGGLSLQGLLLAGIIIGGLGVLDDVTMSQSSTVFALHRADPHAGFAALLRGALGVGRDHIAATVNTLFLAYAGAALPLLILFVVGSDGFGTVLTSEIVAVEVVRTLVGSIGLIAAVPLTTALAAALALAVPRRRHAASVPVDVGGAPDAPEPGAAGGEAAAPGAPGGAAASAQAVPQAPAPQAPTPRAPGAGGLDEDEEWVQRLREAYRLPPDGRR